MRVLPALLALLLTPGCDLRPLSEVDAAVEAGTDARAADSVRFDSTAADAAHGDQGSSQGDGGATGCPGPPLSETADQATLTGWHSAIAVDNSGVIHIAHHSNTTNAAIYSRRDTAGNWTSETVDASGMVGVPNSIAVTLSGTVHIVYGDLTNGTTRHAVLDQGSGWSVDTVAGTGTGGNDLAIDGTGTLHLVTYGPLKKQVVYLSRSAGGWSAPVELEPQASSAAPRPAVAVATDGTVHVAFIDSSGVLKYRSGKGGNFGAPTVLDSGLGSYAAVDLALDATGEPHLVYLDSTSRELRYLTRSGSGFGSPRLIATVGGAVEMPSAIVMDQADRPWIAFFDGNKSRLRAVRSQGGTWQPIQDLDYGGGLYMAAALGPDGSLHISHLHSQTTRLTHTRLCD